MNKNQKLLIFAIIILFIVLLVVSLFIFIQRKQEKSGKVNNQQIQYNQDEKWIYIGHDNFCGQPEHFSNSPDYFFPKIKIYYPESWSFKCCTDTGGGSVHWINPKDSTEETSEETSEDFFIGLKSMSNFVYADDSGSLEENPELKWQSISSNIPGGAKILENMSFKNIEKQRIFAYTYLDNRFNNIRPIKVFVVRANDGFLSINFVNYDNFKPGFIDLFLNKLELED